MKSAKRRAGLPDFLMTVQPIIGRIQIKDDLLRRLGMRFEKQIDQ
jgi:hypothetical protein